MSSKSVARSAGLRSIRRGRQVAVRFRPLSPVPADRSPGPFRSRPLVSSVSVQFVVPSVRLLPVPVRVLVSFCSFPFVPARLFRSACLFSFSRSLVCSARFSFGSVRFSVRLVQSRSLSFSSACFSSGFVPFGSCSVELVLCSRLLAFGFIYIILAYIIH